MTLEEMVIWGTHSVEEIRKELKKNYDRKDKLCAMKAAILFGRIETFRAIATDINKYGITLKERKILLQEARSTFLSKRFMVYFTLFLVTAIKIKPEYDEKTLKITFL